MSYSDPRWQKKRLEILSRDNWRCVACGDSESTLHVHHIKYHGDLWETPDELLQTLCEKCHHMLGPHPIGGPFYLWKEDFYDEEENKNYILVLAYHHCPICGNAEDDSHSGSVIFKCGHSMDVHEAYIYDWQESFDGFPCYWGIKISKRFT